jgi:hypothetical protein
MQRAGKTAKSLSMKYPLTVIVVAALTVIALSGIISRRSVNESVSLRFVCLTNIPTIGTRALILVSNRTEDVVSCPGYGYLGPGESIALGFPIPAGIHPWRASLCWQSQRLSRFDEIMNDLRYRFEVACGEPEYHRPQWLPLARLSYSSKIPR